MCQMEIRDWQTFFCEGPNDKYFRLCGPDCLCCSYSVLPLFVHESSHRWYVKKESGCVPIKLYLQTQAVGQDLALECILPNADIEAVHAHTSTFKAGMCNIKLSSFHFLCHLSLILVWHSASLCNSTLIITFHKKYYN